MDAKELGKFIAQLRKEQKLTQAELAKRLHVTDKAVSRWERGLGFPDINTLEPLSDDGGLFCGSARRFPGVPADSFIRLRHRDDGNRCLEAGKRKRSGTMTAQGCTGRFHRLRQRVMLPGFCSVIVGNRDVAL